MTSNWSLEECAKCFTLSLGAVDQVLLAQWDQFSGFPEGLSLQRASGGKGPAAAALALILDRGDVAFGSPVDRRGNLHVLRRQKGDSTCLVLRNPEAIHDLHKLLRGLEQFWRESA